jgi:D-beta-D-heptose 7-phosphate kinase/D-beta-D-heptose 1-phosphate adenosyltransferase
MQKTLDSSTELDTTQQQTSLKVLLIGESCRDEYRYGVCNRVSPEAPVPVLDFVKEKVSYGMASNVKNNLESFGITVDFLSNKPEDIIRRRFVDLKCHQQLMREDIDNHIKPLVPQSFGEYDAVVFSDYNKGLINEEFISFVLSRVDCPVFVDTKKKDLTAYNNCIIKINKKEYDESVSIPSNSELIVTLGSEGVYHQEKTFPTPKVDVYDVTGAGDVFLSTLVYTYLKTKDFNLSIPESIKMATRSVQHAGTYTLTQDDINEIRS